MVSNVCAFPLEIKQAGGIVSMTICLQTALEVATVLTCGKPNPASTLPKIAHEGTDSDISCRMMFYLSIDGPDSFNVVEDKK
jgi:hypothetical protein